MNVVSKYALLALLTLFAAFGSSAQITPIVHPTNSVWKWLAPSNDPGFGLSWTHLNFDDTSWNDGKMPLGYFENEPIGFGGMTLQSAGGAVLPSGLLSYYFRHTFEWTNETQEVLISSTNWVDDGAAVFINGQELYRISMGSGDFTYYSPLGIEHGDVSSKPAGEVRSARIILTNGLNVIAATVRNHDAGSGDLVWAASMHALVAEHIVFNQEPLSTNIVEEQTLSLSATLSNSFADFQWYSDEVLISGATNSQLVISNAALSHSGSYYLVASNFAGSVTSAVAVVNVEPLRILSPLSTTTNGLQGRELRLAVQVNGPATFHWSFNGDQIDPFLNSSATSNTLVLPSTSYEDTGIYEVFVSNSTRDAGSATFDVTVLDDYYPPRILYVRTSLDLRRVILKFDEPVILTNADIPWTIRRSQGGVEVPIQSVSQNELGDLITIETELLNESYRYSISDMYGIVDRYGNPFPGESSRIVAMPRILLHHTDQWRFNDFSAEEPVGWEMPGFDDSIWKRGAAPIGVETASLPWPLNTILTNFIASRTTYYFRTGLEFYGNVCPPFILRQQIDDGAVIYINGQEISRTRITKVDFGFDTHASGVVNDAILETLELTNICLNTGRNIVAVEVHQIGIGSQDMVFGIELIGFFEPFDHGHINITRDPESQTITEGGQAIFTAAFYADYLPVYFQWYYGSSPIPGATNYSLVFTNANLSNSGVYTLQISNISGTDSSTGAIFMVLPLEGSSFTTNISVRCGRDLELQLTASGPAIYEWYFNGVLVSAETNSSRIATFVKRLFQDSEIGEYLGIVRSVADGREVARATFYVNVHCDPVPPVPITAQFDFYRQKLKLEFIDPIYPDLSTTNFAVIDHDGSTLDIHAVRVEGVYSNQIVLEISGARPDVDYKVTAAQLMDIFGNTAENIERAVAAPVLIMPHDAIWKFDNSAPSAPAGWPSNFSTTGWFEGPGAFSHPAQSFPWETGTVLSEYASYDPSRISYYFATPFQIPSNSHITELFVRYWFDDGGFIYINGREVKRVYMGGTPDTFTNYNINITDVLDEEARLSTTSLRPGSNQVAVAVKQNSTNSSDLYFGMELYATFGSKPQPRLFWLQAEQGITFQWGYPGFKLQTADALWNWSDVPDGSESGVTVPVANTSFFRLRSSD